MSPSHPPAAPLQHGAWASMHATAVHVLPGMLRFLGVAEDDLDDLCQDVLLGAYRSFPRYDPMRPGSARAAALLDSPDPLRFAVAPGQAAVAADSEPSDTPPRLGGIPAGMPDPARPERLGEHWRAEASWLFGIAWRQVRHHLERAYRRREVPVGLADAASLQREDVAPSSEHHIAAKERLALAVRLLSEVAPERRAVLVLADAYDVPVREIARALEINENTAGSRLRLARRDYRAAEKRLRPEERRALRSSVLVLPLFSATSLRALSEAIVPASGPAAPSSRARLGRTRWRARLARLARPFARPGRPALGWSAAGIAGGVLLATALAPAPVTWARHLGAVATPLLVARSAHPAPTPEPHPAGVLGEAPRSGDAVRSGDAARSRDAQGPRAPAARANDGPGQREPASSRRAPAPPDQGQDRLDEELALLDAAKEALLHGERGAALEHIDAHARRFPRSRLTLLRERLRSTAKALPATKTGGAARHERP
ncbi:sigma factor-like helix-turn-helix DNA-binding protein [Sorangium sp. So ce233]|uniref:sigma factor-like helix-turn-helix DNA-binding protein n=1 Tax=Sorangium sp. So ce233 TaxID=3133290 RepID=UPI003F61A5A5